MTPLEDLLPPLPAEVAGWGRPDIAVLHAYALAAIALYRSSLEPVADEHHFRQIGGGRHYTRANLRGPNGPSAPDPDEGFEWYGSSPLYPEPKPSTPEGCMWAVTKGGTSICQLPKRGWEAAPMPPQHATQAMIDAGEAVESSRMSEIWEAMLAAASAGTARA